MRKILLVLLFMISVFGNEKNSTHIKLLNFKGSSWQYNKSVLPHRDQILGGLKIKQKKQNLLLKFYCNAVCTDKEYCIESVDVFTNQRVLLNIQLKNPSKRELGTIGLKFKKYSNEKKVMLRFKDDHNHVTLYSADISHYQSSIKNNFKKRSKILVDKKLYIHENKQTDIFSMVEKLFGNKMAIKTRSQYMNSGLYKVIYADKQGLYIIVNDSKKYSLLAIFSTTVKSNNILSIIVYIPDKDVHFLNYTNSFNIPSWKDGEILVVGEDKTGELHMSQFLHIKSLEGHGNTEEPSTFKIKLDK